MRRKDSDSVSPGSNPGSPANKFNDLAVRFTGKRGTFGAHRTHENRHSAVFSALPVSGGQG